MDEKSIKLAGNALKLPELSYDISEGRVTGVKILRNLHCMAGRIPLGRDRCDSAVYGCYGCDLAYFEVTDVTLHIFVCFRMSWALFSRIAEAPDVTFLKKFGGRGCDFAS